MTDTFLDRLRRGLAEVTDAVRSAIIPASDGMVAARVAKYLAVLNKTRPRLADEIARYVVAGENSSVLSSIANNAIQSAWRSRTRSYPPRDEAGLFAPNVGWNAAQMLRLGQILEALDPIKYDGGYFGTMKSPGWLRHVVTVWLGQDRKNCSLDMLTELAREGGLDAGPVLDILLGRDARTYRDNSIDRFADVAGWLKRNAAAVSDAIPAVGADARATFAAATGRFRLADAYRATLIELALGSSKKARTAARQALIAADPKALAQDLAALYPKAAPGVRVELVEVAAATLGKAASQLLTSWQADESGAKPLATIARVLGADTIAGPSGDDGPEDGFGGYRAIDGSFVSPPPRPFAPVASKIPAAAFKLLEPAAASFNAKLAAARREGEQGRWHWSRQFSPVDWQTLEALRALGEGSDAIGNKHQTAVGWLRAHDFSHPGLAAFFDHDGLTLWHSVRFALASTNGFLTSITNEWSGPAGTALARRIAGGADIRWVLGLWTQFGGGDPVAEHLMGRWHQPWSDMNVPIWPILCDRFPQLDQALGLSAQTTERPFDLQAALDLLALFPKVPRRYQRALMLLASGSAATTRNIARGLLQQAPGIDDAIADLLSDGKQDIRAEAATWLVQRGARDKIGDLRGALKKERSDSARAAMISALERLGDDVSDFFDNETMIREAEAGLAKGTDKALAWFPFDILPELHWRDGTVVDPRLPRWWLTLASKLKQPSGNALVDLWLDRLAPGDAHRLGWMVLTGWIEQDIKTCTVDEANAYATANVAATLQQHLSYVQRSPQSASYFSTDRDVIFEQLKRMKLGTYLGSATDSKGILALCTRVNGADAAQRVRPFLKDHGARIAQAKALVETLASNPSSAALQVVLAAANRSKQRSLQAHAESLVAAIAERRGWTTEELTDRTIPTAGLDSDGTLDLDCGMDRTYTMRLGEGDALILVNAEGKEVKALPAPRIDEEKPLIDAAKKLVATARKEAKQVFTTQTERLYEAMCLGRKWKADEWEAYVAKHPLVGRIAQRLIWLGIDADGATVASFRPLGDGTYSDAADDPVDLSAMAAVQLAHQSLLDPAGITAWQRHLVDYEVTAAFDQIGRSLPKPDKDHHKMRDIRDREGWVIETFKLRTIATKLGYVRGAAGDGGWFTSYERPYRGMGVVAYIEFTGSPLPEENRPAALLSLSFRQLLDRGYHGRQLELGNVPPVLLAECWQDFHDIADKGSGFDADWRKKANA